MNTSELIPVLRQSFSSCTLVSTDLDMVRCERVYKSRPRSVYFFQSVPALPDSEELTKINQEVVSPSYFRAQDASRWNHYVVFVAHDAKKGSSSFRDRQREVEEDKNYARKIVIFRSELEAFVDHSLKRTIPEAPGDSILTVWSRALLDEGLGQIEGNTARALLVREIRAGKFTAEPRATGAKGTIATGRAASPDLGFIGEFQVNRFGWRKLSGAYGFGRVNLLCGPNGSGKTSLLEAIEHFICGGTFRSDGGSEDLEATATFGNRAVVKYKGMTNASAQSKDLRWYGRTINRGNRLFEGFARFNFLNTDAAAHFAGDGSLPDLKEALSMVALGPDAAHTWNRMGEFLEDIGRELGPISNTLLDLTARLVNANARLAALQTDSPQVEAQRMALTAALSSLGWPARQSPDKQADSDWFGELAVLREFVEASRTENTLRSEAGVTEAASQATSDLKALTDLDTRARVHVQQRDTLRRRRIAQERRGVELRRYEHYLRSGFHQLCIREDACVTRAAAISGRLVPVSYLESLRQFVAQTGELDTNFSLFHASLEQRLETERQRLEVSSRQRLEIQNRMRSTETLLSEIRRLGYEFAEAEPHATGCPLCDTAMDMTALAERISGAAHQSALSSDLTTLSGAIGEMSATVERLVAAQLTCDRLSMSTIVAREMTVAQIIDSSLRDHQVMQETQVQLDQIRSELGTLQKAGLSSTEYADLNTRLNGELDADLPHLNLSEVERLIKENDAAVVTLNDEDGVLGHAIEETEAGRETLSQKYSAAAGEAGDARNAIQARLNRLTRMARSLQALPSEIRRDRLGDLGSLSSDANQALKIIDELNAQIQKERARSNEIQVLQLQIVRDQSQHATLKVESERLARAQQVLLDLRTNHSLDVGLSNFLDANLGAIQSIFSKIHVPHELRLSNLAECRLERIDSKQSVDLTRVSTGQRAALVLSVFFALNLSLRQGPPQMLIDDPIAHIDDLNALSFLDFLADIAESGRRQVFFSTANEKLANLFQKKMEFLGDDFKAYQLPAGRLIKPVSRTDLA
jgi:DNA repair protein SbcC/Rad50